MAVISISIENVRPHMCLIRFMCSDMFCGAKSLGGSFDFFATFYLLVTYMHVLNFLQLLSSKTVSMETTLSAGTLAILLLLCKLPQLE